jgi:hypothetical protein
MKEQLLQIDPVPVQHIADHAQVKPHQSDDEEDSSREPSPDMGRKGTRLKVVNE